MELRNFPAGIGDFADQPARRRAFAEGGTPSWPAGSRREADDPEVERWRAAETLRPRLFGERPLRRVTDGSLAEPARGSRGSEHWPAATTGQEPVVGDAGGGYVFAPSISALSSWPPAMPGKKRR
jgi:hypothetical protein